MIECNYERGTEMTITEKQFYDMLNVDEHMNFTNRIQELVFDKK